MYDHNLIELKISLNDEENKKIILDETKRRESSGFCKIKINNMSEELLYSFSGKKAEIEHLGIYLCNTDKIFSWKEVENCEIKEISDENMIDELVKIELAENNGRAPEDFCVRRVQRMGKVYIGKNSCKAYMCYYNGIPVGYCELIIDDKTAKIENLLVDPKYQRKGIGTTILKYLVNKAILEGAEIVYLNADEEDTPKDMYLKLGFKKIYDLYYLFWLF